MTDNCYCFSVNRFYFLKEQSRYLFLCKRLFTEKKIEKSFLSYTRKSSWASFAFTVFLGCVAGYRLEMM